MVLSGTFGELRTNHFHAGLDLKKHKQREGFNVFFCCKKGMFQELKYHTGVMVKPFILHTLMVTQLFYAHLKKFNTKIESYIKKEAIQKGKF